MCMPLGLGASSWLSFQSKGALRHPPPGPGYVALSEPDCFISPYFCRFKYFILHVVKSSPLQRHILFLAVQG